MPCTLPPIDEATMPSRLINGGEPGENAPTPQPALNELAILVPSWCQSMSLSASARNLSSRLGIAPFASSGPVSRISLCWKWVWTTVIPALSASSLVGARLDRP